MVNLILGRKTKGLKQRTNSCQLVLAGSSQTTVPLLLSFQMATAVCGKKEGGVLVNY